VAAKFTYIIDPSDAAGTSNRQNKSENRIVNSCEIVIVNSREIVTQFPLNNQIPLNNQMAAEVGVVVPITLDCAYFDTQTIDSHFVDTLASTTEHRLIGRNKPNTQIGCQDIRRHALGFFAVEIPISIGRQLSNAT
jgi:hypothetical protein